MSLSAILFVVLCFFFGGCRANSSTEPNSGESNTTYHPANSRTSSPTNSGVSGPNLAERGADATQKMKSMNMTSQSSGGDSSKVVDSPRVFDAEDTALPLGSTTECSGTFFDINNFVVNRVSIAVFDIEEDDSTQVPLRLTLQCSFSVVSYTTEFLISSLPSCRDLQRAIANAPLCDSRGSIGGKSEFLGRLQHLFLMTGAGDSTNGVLATSTEGMCPMLVGPSTIAALRVPRRIPTGMDRPIYEIYFEFNRSMELYEFYHSGNVADVACPVALNTGNLQEIRNRLATTINSIMNSI